jgi:Cellulase (glycosyl hydrolase family 5)
MRIRKMNGLKLICGLALLAMLGGAAPQDATHWELAPSGNLQYEIVRDGVPLIDIETSSWGPNWKFFGYPNSLEPESSGVYRAVVKVPDTGREMKVRVHRAAAEKQVAFRYVFEATKEIDLTAVTFALIPSGKAFGKGTLSGITAAGEHKDLPTTLRPGEIEGVFKQITFRTEDGQDLKLDFDPPRLVTSDNAVRVNLIGAKLPAVQPQVTTIRLTFPDEVKSYSTVADALQRTDTTGWFAYPVSRFGPPVDLSFLNRDNQGKFVQAGSHGFLKVDGSHFTFSDGTPAKFWGLNVTAGAALSDPRRAVEIANRLAKMGVNIVRLHHLDSWANPIVDYNAPDGTTQHLDENSMKRLDATITALKQRGIYVMLDPWVQRYFKERDGVAGWENFADHDNFHLHPYVFFDPRMRELIKKQVTAVWTHVNCFSGIPYFDDPAIAMCELANEALMQRGGGQVKL